MLATWAALPGWRSHGATWTRHRHELAELIDRIEALRIRSSMFVAYSRRPSRWPRRSRTPSTPPMREHRIEQLPMAKG